MIEYQRKNITSVKKGIVAHGCNCSGGFGSGVAGAIRKVWPEVYDTFKISGTGKDMLGTVVLTTITDDLVVANCYTQLSFGSDGKVYASLAAIEQCLTLVFEITEGNDHTIYLPKIGAGLGGLNWDTEVFPVIERISKQFEDKNVVICVL